jgi:hypothetical protein
MRRADPNATNDTIANPRRADMRLVVAILKRRFDAEVAMEAAP